MVHDVRCKLQVKKALGEKREIRTKSGVAILYGRVSNSECRFFMLRGGRTGGESGACMMTSSAASS